MKITRALNAIICNIFTSFTTKVTFLKKNKKIKIILALFNTFAFLALLSCIIPLVALFLALIIISKKVVLFAIQAVIRLNSTACTTSTIT